jgi:hypothetical protein
MFSRKSSSHVAMQEGTGCVHFTAGGTANSVRKKLLNPKLEQEKIAQEHDGKN